MRPRGIRAPERVRHRRIPPFSVVFLIAGVVAAAAAALGATATGAAGVVRDHPAKAGSLLGATLALQLLSVGSRRRGSISVSAVALLATGLLLGPGVAIAFAVPTSIAQWLRRRGLLHRAAFDAANLALSAGAAAGLYNLLLGANPSLGARLAAATLSGLAYTSINTGLLCVAMALSESRSAVAIWRERFRWVTVHYLAFGPLALAAALAYGAVGVGALTVLGLSTQACS